MMELYKAKYIYIYKKESVSLRRSHTSSSKLLKSAETGDSGAVGSVLEELLGDYGIGR